MDNFLHLFSNKAQIYSAFDIENFINLLKREVTMNIILIGCLIIVVLIVITLVIRSTRIGKAKKELAAIELKYTELKGIPLSFKLNKAVALSKVNKALEDNIKEYQKEYENSQELLKEYSVILAEIDDYVYSKKIKKANQAIDSIMDVVAKSTEAITELDTKLEEVLKQENTQRENINTLKDRFRKAKNQLNENRSSYHQSVEYLDGLLKNIEDMFSVFEEWMFASEFDKAADKQNDIQSELDSFEVALDKLPPYYEEVKVTLVGAVDELQYLYSSSKAKGVYLEHLEIEKHLDVVNELLSDILSKLSVGTLSSIDKDIDDCEIRIVQMKDDIEKELHAFATIHEKVNILFERIKLLNQKIQKIKEVYDKVHKRFGFENWTAKLAGLDESLDSLNEQRFRLEKVVSENSVPYSTLLLSYEELASDTVRLEDEAKDMSERLDNACSDEERAKQQLIKLQLIVNETRTKIAKNHLPSISEKYDDDIIKANCYVIEIKEVLNNTPLDVELLNAKLQEGIDYIYTLYNSVNNLVGMAIMVENAIIFGNKYRSEYMEVDSELTRAELCFNNGQYTKSLKIAMSIIEKLHPGAYENLVKKGADFNEATQS
ncbi:septation ring formation regulator [Breznakia sp. PF5-3]|uniref:septation ring formation regulator EzrA n=1 Tax=unclassified Breznakia TaxID=2623764 RepID=UPI00240568B6|nr:MULTISPECIES: septation ring formation regulator EzrA [unclassified Breznakia]MDF9823929.1 septation ring formation regulator [Breznakia sp. PM6-1]MDF9834728.1 septation ring formation regulator [Breznakia sp. PF5-3]MDF9836837.1 septation ring formation regulator [Breznakia sp. PFB2-8]MDF9858854.1 septation ring formation regulator [Breznakia sp. PH5-24]